MSKPTLKEQIGRMQFVVEMRSEFERDPMTLTHSKAILESLEKLEEIGKILRQPWCDRHTVHDISKLVFDE